MSPLLTKSQRLRLTLMSPAIKDLLHLREIYDELSRVRMVRKTQCCVSLRCITTIVVVFQATMNFRRARRMLRFAKSNILKPNWYW